ncbi:hypothetical protein [Kitasatospora sp. NPDC048538]|uniref:hypothetical protein n=1 Tax=unclassified Kitasatospora TaxID=2633591 RepID=UPI0033CA6ED9
MARSRARLAAAGAAVVLTVTGLSGAAAADAATPSTGSAVITNDATFLAQAALKGILVVPLQPAAPAYDSTTGLTTTFPVTGGAANIPQFYGDVNLGGGLLFVNLANGKSVTFKQLDFHVDTWQINAVPVGGTTPVALLDPAGDNVIGRTGTTQNLSASSLQVDAAGAQYLDAKLGTSFFTEGQSVGSLALTFTQGS